MLGENSRGKREGGTKSRSGVVDGGEDSGGVEEECWKRRDEGLSRSQQ